MGYNCVIAWGKVGYGLDEHSSVDEVEVVLREEEGVVLNSADL